ncbi:MFS transporter [Nocardia sp. NPDC057353]|uniref:MFS transporter n=1 Tax=Nocardia sp. NPDC057353 TaxID=3346104 RepID=UPI00363C5784
MTAAPATGCPTPGPPPRARLAPLVLPVFVPSAVYGLGNGAAAPMFPLRALELGASPGLAGLVVALAGFGMILMDLPAGSIVARLGERVAIALGSAAGALGMLAAIFAPTIAVFGAGMLLTGAATAVWGLARQSYVVAVVPAADRGRVLSIFAGSMRLGFFVGPFLGAAVVHGAGPAGGLWVQLAAVVLAGALVAVMPEPEDGAAAKGVTGLGTVLREQRGLLTTLGSGALLMGAARAARQVLLPLWAAHIGADAAVVALLFGIAGAVDVLMSYPAGLWMDRFGRRAIGVPSMLCFAAGYAVLPFAGTVVWLGVVALLLGLANGLSNGVIMTVGADIAPADRRAEFLGAWRLTHDFGMFAGPITIGVIGAVSMLGGAAVVLAVSAGAGAAAMYRWFPGPGGVLRDPSR